MRRASDPTATSSRAMYPGSIARDRCDSGTLPASLIASRASTVRPRLSNSTRGGERRLTSSSQARLEVPGPDHVLSYGVPHVTLGHCHRNRSATAFRDHAWKAWTTLRRSIPGGGRRLSHSRGQDASRAGGKIRGPVPGPTVNAQLEGTARARDSGYSLSAQAGQMLCENCAAVRSAM